MPKKKRGSVDSERRRRNENQRLRRQQRKKEDQITAEHRRQPDAEHQREKEDQITAEHQRQCRAEHQILQRQHQIAAKNQRQLEAEHHNAACSEKNADDNSKRTEMPQKSKRSITEESKRRRRMENARLRRENEDPFVAEKRRRRNREYKRRRRDNESQFEAETRRQRDAEYHRRRREVENRIEAENRRRLDAEHHRAARSEENGDVSKWQKEQIPEAICIKGRRIIDFQYFFKALKDMNNHSKAGCNLNNIFIKRESKHGICTSYCLKCAVCNFEKIIWSENPNAVKKNLNTDFLSGILSIKCSFKDANKLFSKMHLPLFCEEVYVPLSMVDSNKTCQNTPENLRGNVQRESEITAVEQCSSASGNSSQSERVDLDGLIVEDKFEIEEETVTENINEYETIFRDQRVRTSDDKLIAGQEQVKVHNSKSCQNTSKNLLENVQRESQLTTMKHCSSASGNSSLLDRADFGNLIIEEQFEIKEENVIENINEFERFLDPKLRTSNDKLLAGQEQVIIHKVKTCQNIPKNLAENVQGESQFTAVKHCSSASGNSSLLERVDSSGLTVEDQFEIKEETVIENLNESETVILDQRMRTSGDKLIAGQEQLITQSNKTCQNTSKNLREDVQRESQLAAVKQCSPASGNSNLLERVDLGGLIIEDQFEIKEETVIENLNESESIILDPRMGTSDDKLIAGQEQAILNMTTIKQEINSDDEDPTNSVTKETTGKENMIDNYEQSIFRTVKILSQQNEERACTNKMTVNQEQNKVHKNVTIIDNQVHNLLVKPVVNTMEIIGKDNMTYFDCESLSDLPRKKTRTEIYKDLYNPANMQRIPRTLRKGINIYQNRFDSNGFVTATSTRGRGNVTSTSSITSRENLTAISSITTRGGNITSLISVQHSPKSNENSTLIGPRMPHNIASETYQDLSGTACTSGVPSAIEQPANASGATNVCLAPTVVQPPVNLLNNTPGATPTVNWRHSSLSNAVPNASGNNICAQQPVKSSNSISRVIPATNILQKANRSKICVQHPVKSSNNISRIKIVPVKSSNNIPRVKIISNVARKSNRHKIYVLQPVKSSNSIRKIKPATNIVKCANGKTYAVL